MTALAIVLLAVWLLGIPLATAALLAAIRSEPLLQLAADANPSAVALFSAVLIVGWPATLLYVALDRAAAR